MDVFFRTKKLQKTCSSGKDHPYRLIFIPANDPIPRLDDDGLDWSKVTEVEIVEIADPH
jgi:hypothetical protein